MEAGHREYTYGLACEERWQLSSSILVNGWDGKTYLDVMLIKHLVGYWEFSYLSDTSRWQVDSLSIESGEKISPYTLIWGNIGIFVLNIVSCSVQLLPSQINMN